MEPLKILIIEDLVTLAQDLKEQLLEFGHKVTASAVNSDEALNAFQQTIPDIVLVDINLGRSKLDGIEIAQEFNKIQRVPIIYLTAYSDTQTRERAKKTKPAYYLVKPCNQMQLEIAIEFSISNFTKKEEALIDHSLGFHTLPENSFYPAKDYFFIKSSGNRLVRVNVSDLLYVQAENSSVEINTQNSRFILSANLASFCRQFSHPSLLRVHRSYVVNLTKVSAIEDNYLIIQNFSVPIGGSYKEKVAQAIFRLQAD